MPNERAIRAIVDLVQTNGNLDATYNNLLPLGHGEKPEGRANLTGADLYWMDMSNAKLARRT